MGTPTYGCRQLDPGSLDGSAANGATHRVTLDQPDTAAATLTAQVSRMLCDAWRFRVDGLWTTALPAEEEHGPPLSFGTGTGQDCRVHLSATPRSAAAMLERVVPVLAERGIVFTFAADLEAVRWLGSRGCDPETAGKVLTAHPAPGAGVAELARELHAATAGLPGPRILSARPYRPQSLVHHGPATSVHDIGTFASSEPRVFQGRGPVMPPLLAGRYLIGQTLRRTPSNDVHLAVDTHVSSIARPRTSPDARLDDARVVIEHARRHADIDEFGQDARTRLLHQARVLRRLSATVPVPVPLRVFALDQDLFLVQRYLSGISFSRWVAAHAADTPGVPLATALPMARRLLRVVSAVHDAGIVLRDLTPSKVLVAPDGLPMLVDLEAACEAGEVSRRIEAGSFRATEHCVGGGPSEAGVAEDLYSLGGLLFLMATGTEPVLPTHDDGHDRQDRLTAWLWTTAAHSESARALAPAALGLLSDDPAHRCDLVTAAARLEPRHLGPVGPEPIRCPGPRRLLDDGLSHLADVMTPCNDRLWPDAGDGDIERVDVQHGASGVLYVFLTDLRTGNQRHREVVRTAADWLAAHLPTPDVTPSGSAPGLYTGLAGPAWTLADAGRMLDEPALLRHAEALARTLPTCWPSAGVASGVAGALLTHLRLFLVTGRDEFAELAAACGRAIRRAAIPTRSGPLWPLPDDVDPGMSETAHYGFAHGAAGVGYALLASGVCLSDERATALASEVGDLLCDVAVSDRDARIRWPVGPANPRRRSHWCTGASGIGTFLVRLWAWGRQSRFQQYARAAADAVCDASWSSSTSACHGISGDGQFLLDAAELMSEPRYGQQAEDLTALLSARYARRRGRGVIADDSGSIVSPSYGTGLAGAIAYLHRLQHPGPRPFMLDDAFVPVSTTGHDPEPVPAVRPNRAVTDPELA